LQRIVPGLRFANQLHPLDGLQNGCHSTQENGLIGGNGHAQRLVRFAHLVSDSAGLTKKYLN